MMRVANKDYNIIKVYCQQEIHSDLCCKLLQLVRNKKKHSTLKVSACFYQPLSSSVKTINYIFIWSIVS